ncbi:uncharacterized protein LOC144435758 isoform X2 [Glandiceps talaboti]
MLMHKTLRHTFGLVFLQACILAAKETLGLVRCNLDRNGVQSVGIKDIYIPLNYDLYVEPGTNLILDSGVTVNTSRENVCVTRTRTDGTSESIVGCEFEPNVEEKQLTQNELVSFDGHWALNVSNVQNDYDGSTFTWKYSDSDDLIGQTTVNIIGKHIEVWQVNTEFGRSMAVVWELNELDAKDVSFESPDGMLFFFENVNGEPSNCYMYNDNGNIFSLHGNNFIAINFDNVSCDNRHNYTFTVSVNEYQSYSSFITLQINDKHNMSIRLTHQPIQHDDTAVLQCTANSPLHALTWFFNDDEIVDDDRHNIQTNELDSTLYIYNVGSSDLGTYSCVVKSQCSMSHKESINLYLPGHLSPTTKLPATCTWLCISPPSEENQENDQTMTTPQKNNSRGCHGDEGCIHPFCDFKNTITYNILVTVSMLSLLSLCVSVACNIWMYRDRSRHRKEKTQKEKASGDSLLGSQSTA